MKNLITATFIFILAIPAFAGDGFKVKAKVDSVKTSGYFRIQLNPDIISFANTGYDDIRLLKANGTEVPYIFREEEPATSITGFKEYPILANEYLEAKKLSRVVFENKAQNIISSLALVIRNSEIVKEITLKGSDNNQNWFIIWKGIPQKSGIFSETAGIFTIDFPKSDFKYFELSTSDKHKDPIQINKVGYYDSKTTEGLYSEVPVKKMSQKDSSDKKTYVVVEFERPYEFSKMELKVSGAELFLRNATIGQYLEDKNRKVFSTFGNFELSSSKPIIWETGKLKQGELVIIIDNLDNNPLKVENVKFYHLNKYLVAQLEKGETYIVKSGNENLSYPDYDLKYFADSLPDTIKTLHLTQVTIEGDDPAPSSFFTKTILWAVILVVIMLLAFFSVRLVREMAKK